MSSDYGNTWNVVAGAGNQPWYIVSISSNGLVQAAITYDNNYFGNIYSSNSV